LPAPLYITLTQIWAVLVRVEAGHNDVDHDVEEESNGRPQGHPVRNAEQILLIYITLDIHKISHS